MIHPIWIWQYAEWPHFCWNNSSLIGLLARVHEKQGYLLGMMNNLGFDTQATTSLETLTEDVLRNAEIEGLVLNKEHVRSSVAKHLGIDLSDTITPDRYCDGVVQVLIDAVQHANTPLTEERLFNWHAALFPTGRSGISPIRVGNYRIDNEPMQVISGPMGKERIHYEAPPSENIPNEMKKFLHWFNEENAIDNLLKAGVAHLWFVNIHPFDDGNGRLTRTLTNMLLARSDGQPKRFYSMSAAILRNKKSYYEILEYTGKHGLDITQWLTWFLQTLEDAIDMSQSRTLQVLKKSMFWQRHQNTILNERQIKMINRLWNGFEGKLSTGKWAKMTKSSTATALRDIQDLVSKNILKKTEENGRSTNYELII